MDNLEHKITPIFRNHGKKKCHYILIKGEYKVNEFYSLIINENISL
jgi:hypothetical protein